MKCCFLVLTFYLSVLVMSQGNKTLVIGDTVPDIEFNLLNNEKQTVKLSNYRGKLVILDFWATWCGSCVTGFKKAEYLQKIFGSKIQFLLVNSSNRAYPDSKEELNIFFEKWFQKNPKFTLPIAFEDTTAFSLFPHAGIPHYVWIDSSRTVIAITSTNDLTVSNISNVLEGRELKISVKEGFYSDILYLDGLIPVTVKNIDNYSLFMKGKLEGISTVITRDAVKLNDEFLIRRVIMRNRSLLDMYGELISYNKEFKYNSKRLLIEVADSQAINKDLYTYDLIIPPTSSDNLYNIMIGELNRYTSYVAGIEKRKVMTLVLVRTSKEDKIRACGQKYGARLSTTDSIKYIYNKELSFLIKDLNRTVLKIAVLDETGYAGKVDIKFKYYGDDIQKLRNELQRYDLDLIEAEREIEMFVIRDKPKPKTTTNNE